MVIAAAALPSCSATRSTTHRTTWAEIASGLYRCPATTMGIGSPSRRLNSRMTRSGRSSRAPLGGISYQPLSVIADVHDRGGGGRFGAQSNCFGSGVGPTVRRGRSPPPCTSSRHRCRCHTPCARLSLSAGTARASSRNIAGLHHAGCKNFTTQQQCAVIAPECRHVPLVPLIRVTVNPPVTRKRIGNAPRWTGAR